MSKATPYWDDVEEGMELPAIHRGPIGTEEIVRFSAAVENYEQLHHDYRWVTEHGFADIPINGPLKYAILATLMTEWIGEDGFLKKVACSHRGMDHPGHTLTAKGKVTGKRIEGGLGYVDCEIWIENQKGEITSPGSATAVLPMRGEGQVPLEYPVPLGYADLLR
jgi:acyl dehydratase